MVAQTGGVSWETREEYSIIVSGDIYMMVVQKGGSCTWGWLPCTGTK